MPTRAAAKTVTTTTADFNLLGHGPRLPPAASSWVVWQDETAGSSDDPDPATLRCGRQQGRFRKSSSARLSRKPISDAAGDRPRRRRPVVSTGTLSAPGRGRTQHCDVTGKIFNNGGFVVELTPFGDPASPPTKRTARSGQATVSRPWPSSARSGQPDQPRDIYARVFAERHEYYRIEVTASASRIKNSRTSRVSRDKDYPAVVDG